MRGRFAPEGALDREGLALGVEALGVGEATWREGGRKEGRKEKKREEVDVDVEVEVEFFPPCSCSCTSSRLSRMNRFGSLQSSTMGSRGFALFLWLSGFFLGWREKEKKRKKRKNA